jgi:hypothetical protein
MSRSIVRGAFDALELVEERDGLALELHLHHGVEIRSGVGARSHRLRFVDAGTPDGPGHIFKSQHGIAGFT